MAKSLTQSLVFLSLTLCPAISFCSTTATAPAVMEADLPVHFIADLYARSNKHRLASYQKGIARQQKLIQKKPSTATTTSLEDKIRILKAKIATTKQVMQGVRSPDVQSQNREYLKDGLARYTKRIAQLKRLLAEKQTPSIQNKLRVAEQRKNMITQTIITTLKQDISDLESRREDLLANKATITDPADRQGLEGHLQENALHLQKAYADLSEIDPSIGQRMYALGQSGYKKAAFGQTGWKGATIVGAEAAALAALGYLGIQYITKHPAETQKDVEDAAVDCPVMQ